MEQSVGSAAASRGLGMKKGLLKFAAAAIGAAVVAGFIWHPSQAMCVAAKVVGSKSDLHFFPPVSLPYGGPRYMVGCIGPLSFTAVLNTVPAQMLAARVSVR